MSFPLFKLRGWGKRFAVQPKPNCSEGPLCNSFDQIGQSRAEDTRAADGLGQCVARRAELTEQRSGREILVEALGAQVEIAAKPRRGAIDKCL